MGTMYREWSAPRALNGVVRCLWESADQTPKRIVPDGCLDLVAGDDDVFVAGPDTGPWLSVTRPGTVLSGLRFEPGRATDVLGTAADELRDRRISLRDLWGRQGESLTEQVLAGGLSLCDVVTARQTRSPDPAVIELVSRLEDGTPRVSAAIGRLDVGERQLRRRFTLAVGYGPATYLRIARFQRAIGSGRTADLATLAASAGYADQAHLSRDCRELTGTTAREFFRG